MNISNVSYRTVAILAQDVNIFHSSLMLRHIKEGYFIDDNYGLCKIRTPGICTYGSKCNGKCKNPGNQFNHPSRKYCLEINCTSPDCDLNHLLDWKGIPDKNKIKFLSAEDYARGIYSIYNRNGNDGNDDNGNEDDDTGKEIIWQLPIDNVDSSFALFKALYDEILLTEQMAFERQDPIIIKQILDKKNEELRKEEMLKKEKRRLGRMMVKVLINIRNSGDVEEEYTNNLKLKFHNLNKSNLFQLILEFLGPR